MRSALMKTLRAFRKDDDGVTLVEYGVALTLAVAVGIGALTGLGTTVSGKMDGACGAMNPSITVCP